MDGLTLDELVRYGVECDAAHARSQEEFLQAKNRLEKSETYSDRVHLNALKQQLWRATDRWNDYRRERDGRLEGMPMADLLRHVQFERLQPEGRDRADQYSAVVNERIGLLLTTFGAQRAPPAYNMRSAYDYGVLHGVAATLDQWLEFAMSSPIHARMLTETIEHVSACRHNVQLELEYRRALALAGSLHPRLGRGSALGALDPELLSRIAHLSFER